MNAVKLLPYYTYEDYCNWEGRWELIEGIPFAMSPAPTPRHQWLIANIIFELKTSLKNAKCSHCKVYDFIDVKVEEDTILQPDCLMVCNPINKKFLDFPPALVVEILSPATALKDRHTKFSLYEKFGIRYYIIIDEEKNKAEIYHLENSKYVFQKSTQKNAFTFNLTDECSINVALKNFWE